VQAYGRGDKLIGKAFYENVEKHEDLTWLGVTTDGEVTVEHKTTGCIHVMPVSTITEETWKDLEAVMTGKREASVMIHLSRIVGYYSRVKNWNRSKQQELSDRQSGQYVIPDKTGDIDQTMPKEVADILAGSEGMVCKVPELVGAV